MPGPFVKSYDPTTGLAEVDDGMGTVHRVHRSGLSGDLATLGMQADSMAAPQQSSAPFEAFATPPRAAVPGDAAPISFGGESQANPQDAMPFAATPQMVAHGDDPPIDFNRPLPAASPQASPASTPQGQPNAADFRFRPEGAGNAANGGNPYLDGTQPRFVQLPTSTRTQTARQETERMPLSGEAATLAQRVDDANTQQQNAAIGLAANQQAGFEAQAQLANNRAALQERQAADRQRRTNDREAERQRLMAQANELIDASKKEIEPNRILGGAGSKILAALSVALGAAGAAVTGGENVGLKMITAAIDRDIEAQRENRLSKAEAAKGKLSALQLASQITDDEMTQRDIAHASMLEAATQLSAARIAELGAQDVPENLTMLHGELEQAAAMKRAQIAQSLGNQAVINTTSRQVGGGVVDMAQRHAQAQGGEIYTPELAGKMVPRAGGYHPDDTVRRELTKIGQQYGTMQDAIASIRREVRDASSAVPGSESRKRLEQNVRMLQRLVGGNALLELGVPSANDSEVQAAVAGDVPTVADRLRGNGAVVFENLGKILTGAEQGQYRDRGVIPLEDLPPMWESRRVVPVESVTGTGRANRAAADFQAVE